MDFFYQIAYHSNRPISIENIQHFILSHEPLRSQRAVCHMRHADDDDDDDDDDAHPESSRHMQAD